jgi:hypothetical protein
LIFKQKLNLIFAYSLSNRLLETKYLTFKLNNKIL